MKRRFWILCSGLLLGLGCGLRGAANAEPIVSFDNLGDEDLESDAFRLTRPLTLHITAEGAGDSGSFEQMYAYGWILNATTREIVWQLKPNGGGPDYTFNGDVSLPAGDFIAYYAAYGSWRNNQRIIKIFGKVVGRIDINTGKHRRARNSGRWGLRIDTRSESDTRFVDHIEPPEPQQHGESPKRKAEPARDSRLIAQLIGMSDNDFEQRAFTLPQRMQVTVYCQGEYDEGSQTMADTGWILNAENRKRVWELGPDNFKHGGGAAKNKMSREVITLPAGSYIVSYACDGSHATDSWNAPPPYDPEYWGITIWAGSAADARRVQPYKDEQAERVFVSMIRQGERAYATQGFTLQRRMKVRVYAIGEYSFGSNEFADYGWIESFNNHNKVWSMTQENTQPAGGAQKNRMADAIIDLPAGDYVVYYMTDDTHSYKDWNSPPPHDPTHWGVTLSGLAGFDKSQVKLFDAEQRSEGNKNYIVRMIRVGVDQHVTRRFHLDRPTRVRIVCLGEGVEQEMFDYGWIEDTKSGTSVWEMTGRNSRPAGGARKNRRFDGLVLLDRGDYEAHYVTDGSHAWGDWNDTPPPEPHLWGLTILAAPENGSAN